MGAEVLRRVAGAGVVLVLGLSAGAAAQVELCNGEDDDHDGLADEDFPCRRGDATDCAVPSGEPGRAVCSVACTWSTCRPTVELCNGLDDDGDGTADEDFECAVGAEAPCGEGELGRHLCLSDCRYGRCVIDERCNHIDDDADGRVDEGVHYQTFVAENEELLPGAQLYYYEDTACTDDLVLGVVEGPQGLVALVVGADGHRMRDPQALCRRPERIQGSDYSPIDREVDPPGGQALLVDDHFLVSCIGWASDDAYVADQPHLLLYRVGFDGVVEGPVHDVPPVELDGEIYTPGAADMELTDAGVALVYALAVGPRHFLDPLDGPVHLMGQLLDSDGSVIAPPHELVTRLVGDTRAKYRVRQDERGPVLFVRELASGPSNRTSDGMAMWRYRYDPVAGALSERVEMFPSSGLEMVERFAGGWAFIDLSQGIGLREDDGTLRHPPTYQNIGWYFPFGRPRGRVVGEELLLGPAGPVTRMAPQGALSGSNYGQWRPLDAERLDNDREGRWRPIVGVTCISPSGRLHDLWTWTWASAFRDPLIPQYIGYTLAGCRPQF